MSKLPILIVSISAVIGLGEPSSRGKPVGAVNENMLQVASRGDSTSSSQRLDQPFLSLETALAKAHSGDTVFVQPGLYTPPSTLSAKFVAYTFAPNTIVLYTNAGHSPLIGDGSFVVSGNAKIIANAGNSQNSLVDVRDRASDVAITAQEITRTNQGPVDTFLVQQTAGRLSVRANKFFDNCGAAPLYWEGGEMHSFGETVEGKISPAIYSICTATNDWYHNGDVVRGRYIYQDGGNISEAGVWIRIAKGICTGEWAGVQNLGGKLYLDAQKLSAQSLDQNKSVFEIMGGKVWAHVMKTTSSQRQVSARGGLNLLTIDHMEDVDNKSSELLFFDGGETHLRGQLYRGGTNSSGINFASGEAIIESAQIDTSSSLNPSNRSPVFVSGPGLVLKNATLVAKTGVPSINAETKQSIVIDGVLKANTAPGTNVTLTGGILQLNNTNFFPGSISAKSNIAAYRFATNLLSIDTTYTNSSEQRATVYLSVALGTTATRGSSVELRATESDGTLDINPIGSGPGVVTTNVLQVSTKLDPGARFILTNIGMGTASIVRSKIVYE